MNVKLDLNSFLLHIGCLSTWVSHVGLAPTTAVLSSEFGFLVNHPRHVVAWDLVQSLMIKLNALKSFQVTQIAVERGDSFQKGGRHCCSFDVKIDHILLSCNRVSIEIYCLVLQGKSTNAFWSI